MCGIKLVLRLKEGALGYFGVPCNSYTWLSKPQHCRSSSNPFGSGFFSWVHAGNILGSRTCLLIALCVARNIKWFIENPDGSTISLFPYLLHILSFAQVLPERTFWWGAYKLQKWMWQFYVYKWFSLMALFTHGEKISYCCEVYGKLWWLESQTPSWTGELVLEQKYIHVYSVH